MVSSDYVEVITTKVLRSYHDLFNRY
jgi:hypothetical protein